MGAYTEDWKRLNGMRTGLFGWSIGGLLLLLVASRIVDVSAWPPPMPMLATCAYLAVWACVVVFYYFQVAFFRCPRCHAFFQSSGQGRASGWLPRAECGHCGLKRYEDA